MRAVDKCDESPRINTHSECVAIGIADESGFILPWYPSLIVRCPRIRRIRRIACLTFVWMNRRLIWKEIERCMCVVCVHHCPCIHSFGNNLINDGTTKIGSIFSIVFDLSCCCFISKLSYRREYSYTACKPEADFLTFDFIMYSWWVLCAPKCIHALRCEMEHDRITATQSFRVWSLLNEC